MKEQNRKLLDKAARAIHAAEVLLAAGEVDFAAGRAYYAMFYAAEALLYERGLRSRKHSGVHSLFGEHFAKPGLIGAKFHRWLVTPSTGVSRAIMPSKRRSQKKRFEPPSNRPASF